MGVLTVHPRYVHARPWGSMVVGLLWSPSPQEALKFVKKYGSEKVRVLEFVRNRGKGGAVRMVG